MLMTCSHKEPVDKMGFICWFVIKYWVLMKLLNKTHQKSLI